MNWAFKLPQMTHSKKSFLSRWRSLNPLLCTYQDFTYFNLLEMDFLKKWVHCNKGRDLGFVVVVLFLFFNVAQILKLWFKNFWQWNILILNITPFPFCVMNVSLLSLKFCYISPSLFLCPSPFCHCLWMSLPLCSLKSLKIRSTLISSSLVI